MIGGPDLRLPPDLAAGARVVRLDIEAPWPVVDRYAQTLGRETLPAGEPVVYGPDRSSDEQALEWAVSAEIEPELSRCAAGARPLEARIRIDALTYDDRFASLWDGRGRDRIEGLVEFADPAAGGAIVGRYRIVAETPSGKALTRIVSDRTDALAEAFGRRLCLEAFGRDGPD
ncbi:hypothetical protein [Phenylobacterium sp. J367]|uniref:hypothetical protein n=1 Tax=Phenylobacterium sp. J367 TaxID=2898435 RepID=UPI002150EDCA|nr:hypothetical protein [Phenylobacterium sp. J367]MCR5879145.1 hypothetical protein [Phenylobacterium sp. J367]